MSITPVVHRHGWAGPQEAKRAYGLLGANFPHFFIAAQTAPTQGKRVVLWDASRKVNGGKHLPTFKQEDSDCVSMGAINVVDYLSCADIVLRKESERYRPSYQPYVYGISRVQIGGGRLGSSGGSLGIWAADGLKKYGTLWADHDGVPPYSGAVARSWGNSGPPAKFISYAQQFKVGAAAKMDGYASCRDAIVNGYPVTIASNRGFLMRGRADRGKLWGVPSGVWNHQMCLIGVDDDPARPGCYCLNSWGPDAHGQPLDDAPPGGFWVDAEVVDYICRQDDSWAFSQFSGFPEQKLNLLLI